MCRFLDHAPDVKSFCKNAGPQAFRIDYLSEKGRLSFYTPDFIVRISAKEHILIKTKGREDRDVSFKARAAVAWCGAASQDNVKWVYLYVPQNVFKELSDNKLKTLLKMCKPSLKQLLNEISEPQLSLPFGESKPGKESGIFAFHAEEKFSALPTRYRKAIEQANNLERTLVDQNGLMPIGLLRWCFDYTRTTRRNIEGVFESVRNRFTDIAQTELFRVIGSIYKFRNEYVAHQDRELSDTELTKKAVKEWSDGLYNIWKCS